MDIEVLNQFLDVCREESISKAAEKNYISKQALTVSMNKLEVLAGAQLFSRSNKGISLTEAGKYFRSQALRVTKEWQKTLENLRQTQSNLDCVSLGFSTTTICDSFLTELIGRSLEHEHFNFAFFNAPPDMCWIMLKLHELDVAYTVNRLADESFIAQPIELAVEREPLIGAFLLTATTSDLSEYPSISMEDLSGRPILFASDILTSETKIGEYCRSANARLIYTPPISGVQQLLAEQNIGSIILPASAVPHFASPKLRAIPISDYRKKSISHLIYPKNADSKVGI